MGAAWRAGAAYFALVFAIGFALGVLRVLVLAPALGETAAVAAEVPVMLVASWLASRWLVGAFRVSHAAPQRLAMGGLAFGLLIAAEFALGSLATGRGPAAQVSAWATAAGAIGLAGQVAFALIPWLQGVLARRH